MSPGAIQTAFEPGVGFETSGKTDRVARFRLDARIGRGAVAEVWRATAIHGGRFALKFLRPEYSSDPAAISALRREAKILGRLEHSAIVTILDVVEPAAIVADSPPAGPAIVMEWLAGGDLVSLAGADPQHWIRAVTEVHDALGYLHALGLVHGDVKARNVMFDRLNRSRLIDFSCAVRSGARLRRAVGTVTQQRWRSQGHTVSVDDDIHAFAAMIYELVNGDQFKPGVAWRRGVELCRDRRCGGASNAMDALIGEVMTILNSVRPTQSYQHARLRLALNDVQASIAAAQRSAT